MVKLGVNIDHVATIRNARGGMHPEPERAAILAQQAGADIITIHLREDRRHIIDSDVSKIMDVATVPVNLEMGATEEMLELALKTKPKYVCLVPENRLERTTEGGLDVVKELGFLTDYVSKLSEGGISTTAFIEPDFSQIEASKHVGFHAIEIHTGKYANLDGPAQSEELEKIRQAAQYAASIGLEVHAGHGLTYENTPAIAAIPEFTELHIGHFLIGEAVFVGLGETIRQMNNIIKMARS